MTMLENPVTTTDTSTATSTATTASPLSSLTAAEITATAAILGAAGLVTESTRFAYVGLLEPHKSEVLA
jgi:primary-amine oxidase